MLDVSIKEAVDAGMDLGFLERELEINESEEWVPEQQDWKALQNMADYDFNVSLNRILTGWALNTYAQRYDGV